jgi:hypothetical protein
MKKNPNKRTRPAQMRPEYDFRSGVRGKHAAQYASGANVVVLAPDVAARFQSSEEVNDTLRMVAKLLERRQTRAPKKTG